MCGLNVSGRRRRGQRRSERKIGSAGETDETGDPDWIRRCV